MNNDLRKQEHKKNQELESIFPEMENILGSAEKIILDKYLAPQKKIYLIFGCARSGTTLLYQYLAATGLFTYPSNIISRFYYAPYIGARIQQLLIDFDSKNEIFKNSADINFNSTLGKSTGPLQPHEFWYFWNRFFEFKEIQKLNKEEINKVNWSLLKKELHAFESVFDKPILMKAMNLNWHIKDLATNFNNIHFIFIKRDTVYNAQSLLLAREKYFGNRNDWYSFKPPNYSGFSKLPIEEQLINQVNFTNNDIENQLEKLDSSKVSIINYTDFCKSPFKALNDFGIGFESYKIKNDINFRNGNEIKTDKKTFTRLLELNK